MIKLKNIWFNHQNKLITLTDQGLVSGVNFLMGILLARWIGLENYGLFTLGWMVVLFASSIHQSAFISSLFALLPKKENQDLFIKKMMGLQVLFSGFTILTVSILGIISSPFIEDFSTETLLITAVISGVFTLNDFLRRVGFAKQLSTVVLRMDLVGYFFQPFFLFSCYYFLKLDVNTSLTVILFTYCISSLYGITQLGCKPNYSGIKNIALEVWTYSRFLIGTSLLQWLSGNFYLLTAAGLLGPSALGAIRIAQNVMGVMHVLLLTLENLVPLQAAKILNKYGESETVKYVFRMFVQTAVPFIGILIPIALFRSELLEVIYGNQYANYSYVLLAFCLIYVFVFVGTQLRFLIRTFERNNLIFWSYVMTSIVGVTTANLFVSNFKIYGVLMGLMLSQIIMVGYYVFTLKSELKWLVKK